MGERDRPVQRGESTAVPLSRLGEAKRSPYLSTGYPLDMPKSQGSASMSMALPVTLAGRLGMGEPVDSHLNLGSALGRVKVGDKIMTLVASSLAGGDCIDDADALSVGATGRVLGCVVEVPSTLGFFLRSFRWGHVRQLDRVSRELLARAWSAGTGPGTRC